MNTVESIFESVVKGVYARNLGVTKNKDIAMFARLSEGRISQILGNPQRVDSRAIESILRPIASGAGRTSILSAWAEARYGVTFLPNVQVRPDREPLALSFSEAVSKEEFLRSANLPEANFGFLPEIGFAYMSCLEHSRFASLAEWATNLGVERRFLSSAIASRAEFVRCVLQLPNFSGHRTLLRKIENLRNFVDSHEPVSPIDILHLPVQRMVLREVELLTLLHAVDRKFISGASDILDSTAREAHKGIEECSPAGLGVDWPYILAFVRILQSNGPEASEALKYSHLVPSWIRRTSTHILHARALMLEGKWFDAEHLLLDFSMQCGQLGFLNQKLEAEAWLVYLQAKSPLHKKPR